MMLNPCDEDKSINYYKALYDSDDEAYSEDDESMDEELAGDEHDNERDSPTPPPHSPITPVHVPQPSPDRSRSLPCEVLMRPLRRHRYSSRLPVYEREPSPNRSRSPLSRRSSHSPVHEPELIVLGIYNKELERMSDPTDELPMGEMEVEYYVPDSHALYAGESSTSIRGSSSRSNARGDRGRLARTRGQTVRGRGGVHRRRQASSWEPGQPLQEVWLSDDDVPAELREMVRDVVRRRQKRIEETEAQRRNQRRMRSRVNEVEDSESEHEDEFHDANGGKSNALLEGVDPHFDWSPMETFHCVEEVFTPERTGAVCKYESAYDAFRSFWDDSILRTIVRETNRYASQIRSASFQSEWYETNAHEIICLFAFWMMTGIIRMPTMKSYFSKNSLLKTEVFSKIFTYRRYINLNRALHFVDTTQENSANPTNNGVPSFDRMHRLTPIIDHLNLKFQSNYVMSKDICIDESLTLWKGTLAFKQYIRSKAAKFGIKTFEVCESATGYLWSFLVYTGEQSSESGINKSTSLVLKLIGPLLNKGYRLFMDSWFNSPLLARLLKRNGTDCVGTLRHSRLDVPRIVTQAPLQQGQLVARHSGDVCVLSWMDKRRVNMISTCHGSATALPSVASRPPLRPLPFKPQMILDYNRCMGGVDLKDQVLEPYLLERKRCMKWYHKLFKRLLNCSIHNARILVASSQKTKLNTFEFRLELVDLILTRHHPLIPSSLRVERSSHRNSVPLLSSSRPISSNTHWPVFIPSDTTRQNRVRCVVCFREGRKNIKSPYKCEVCDVPLCANSCFKQFHITPQSFT